MGHRVAKLVLVGEAGLMLLVNQARAESFHLAGGFLEEFPRRLRYG